MEKQAIWQRVTAVITTFIVAAFGFTSFAAADSLVNTGPDSSNHISTFVTDRCTVTNTNTVHVTARNDQSAETGDATVSHNTTGGDANSGDATNDNANDVAATIDNSAAEEACACAEAAAPVVGTDASISTTGPDSWNSISTDESVTTTVTNTNNLSDTTESEQSANTGDAKVADNTTAGDASSGDATNANVAMFFANLKNDSPAVVAPVVAGGGSDGCGNTSTPPVGGMGGGSLSSGTYNQAAASYTAYGGSGRGYGSWTTSYRPAVAASVAPSVAAHVAPAVGGMGTSDPVKSVATPASSSSSISNTGPDSHNSVSSDYASTTTVTNTNNVSVNSCNTQTATSGSASTSDNTSGGSADSGNAGNTNQTGGDITITN